MELARLLETLESLKSEQKQYSDIATQMADEARRWKEKADTVQAQITELERESVGKYKGRNTYSQAEVCEARRSIRGVIPATNGKTMGEICQDLPHLARELVEREVDYLVSRGALKWTGGRGLASKYFRNGVS